MAVESHLSLLAWESGPLLWGRASLHIPDCLLILCFPLLSFLGFLTLWHYPVGLCLQCHLSHPSFSWLTLTLQNWAQLVLLSQRGSFVLLELSKPRMADQGRETNHLTAMVLSFLFCKVGWRVRPNCKKRQLVRGQLSGWWGSKAVCKQPVGLGIFWEH